MRTAARADRVVRDAREGFDDGDGSDRFVTGAA
jgi:hypothetical protein